MSNHDSCIPMEQRHQLSSTCMQRQFTHTMGLGVSPFISEANRTKKLLCLSPGNCVETLDSEKLESVSVSIHKPLSTCKLLLPLQTPTGSPIGDAYLWTSHAWSALALSLATANRVCKMESSHASIMQALQDSVIQSQFHRHTSEPCSPKGRETPR